jgi:hypothetical protein
MSSNLATPAGFTAQDLVFEDNFSGTSLNASSWNTFMTSNAAQESPWNPNGNGGSGLGATNNADYIPTSSSHGGEPVFPVPDLAAFAFTTKNAALQ